jgi:hypothetical protein
MVDYQRRGVAMKPQIDSTEFGSITIAGREYDADVVIELDGTVRKRKKKLSKALYGTSHLLSKDEAKDVYQEGAVLLIVGTGQEDSVRLSAEAGAYFAKRGLRTRLLPTPEAIEAWNEADGHVLGLFHVTC